MKINYKIKGNVLIREYVEAKLTGIPHITGYRASTLDSERASRIMIVRTKNALSVAERSLIKNMILEAFDGQIEEHKEWVRGHYDKWVIAITFKEGYKVSFGKEYIEMNQIYEGKVQTKG